MVERSKVPYFATPQCLGQTNTRVYYPGLVFVNTKMFISRTWWQVITRKNIQIAYFRYSLRLKRHLDRFSLVEGCEGVTNRQTDRQTRSTSRRAYFSNSRHLTLLAVLAGDAGLQEASHANADCVCNL